MKWIAFSLVVILSNGVSASSTFETVYEGESSRVILTNSGQLSESELNKFGKATCSSKRFCVLWFYSNKDDAAKGEKAMRGGDMFAQTPGMYGIFSKNKVTNNVICYEPSSGC